MNSFETINLKHGSDEWLNFRKRGIGGSDASAILGLNPWKTNVELWREKAGLGEPKAISCAEAVEYGSNAEAPLARLFELDFPEYTLTLPKDVVYLREGFMLASLDGELTERSTGRKGILEIKTTTIFASMQREKWREQIPQNYYIQILHYLYVTNKEYAILKAQLKGEQNGSVYLSTKHYFIDANDEGVQDDINYLVVKEHEFWECVKNKKPPALILPF